MSFDKILEGHLKEIFNLNQGLLNSRLNICKKCKLSEMSKFGIICSESKWYDPINDKIYEYPKDGTINGCGCRMYAKGRLKNEKCVLNKWNE